MKSARLDAASSDEFVQLIPTRFFDEYVHCVLNTRVRNIESRLDKSWTTVKIDEIALSLSQLFSFQSRVHNWLESATFVDSSEHFHLGNQRSSGFNLSIERIDAAHASAEKKVNVAISCGTTRFDFQFTTDRSFLGKFAEEIFGWRSEAVQAGRLNRNYEYDVFISYARLDDYADNDLGWITKLERMMEQRLSEHLGRWPRIWRDVYNLSPTDNFEEKIYKALDSTAVLVIVMSPTFVEREWFKKEFAHFYQSSMASGGVSRRVFNVFKTETDRTAMPDYLQNMLGVSLTSDASTDEGLDERLRFLTQLAETVRHLQYVLPSIDR